MKKKIILVVVLIVLLLGAGVAYAYFATDAFKTDKDIFLSYLMDENMWKQQPEDKKLVEYFEKKENTAYTNEGKATLNIEGIEDEGIDILNGSSLKFRGSVNQEQKLAEQEITANLSTGINVPIKLKKDNETYGLQTNLLNAKFLAIKNENLKALAEKFEMDSTNIPDKIEFKNTSFTEEEIKTLKEKYLAILVDNLPEDAFSKEKVGKQTVITLNIAEEKFFEIITKVLETLRDDEMILSKIPAGYDTEKIKAEINAQIEDMKEYEKNPDNKVEVKQYIESKEMKMLEIKAYEGDTEVVNFQIKKETNKITITAYEHSNLIVEFVISKEVSGNDVAIIVKMKVVDESIGNATIKIQLKNVLTLDNVEETIDIQMAEEGEEMNIKMNFSNLIKFEESQIEKLDESNSIILNDATDKELQNLILGIYQNLGLM